MARTHSIKASERFYLRRWLRQLDIPIENLQHRFSDATEMAKLLHRLYPKRVQLHNYTPGDRLQLRFDNWNCLNRKVLTKLKVKQRQDVLLNLASGLPGEIECLLCKVMYGYANRKMFSRNRRKNAKKIVKTESDSSLVINPDTIVAPKTKKTSPKKKSLQEREPTTSADESSPKASTMDILRKSLKEKQKQKQQQILAKESFIRALYQQLLNVKQQMQNSNKKN